ncbi:putative phosphatidate phosphatase isoform X2 [Drosophila hydei]|uniref:Phosphatidate phosphatase isoform X2 n=1 Tax=Drosophila hydei TaxID=7224 RepID=A0A6J1M430_DROHY|nr:putative phosphatidate phosphatase isoform X2 [Drosophila hydei]XP_030079715.1 putative phosphatidate phosphatase isoform X2 [Drosophila hydei]
MSNESSASETTPLRRPESQLSAGLVANVASSNYNKHVINIGISPPAQTTALTANNDSNAIIEERLQGVNNNNNNSNSNHTQQQQQHTKNMDTNKRILCRVGLDILILLCVGLPILWFFLFGDPYKRGFFCDDESLKHPFKESTVRNWMLYIIGLVIPVGVMLIVELQRSRNANASGTGSARRYIFMSYEIPDWLVECYKKMGVFAFGAAASQLTTDIAKYSIGRLRPHFIAVCQPQMPDWSTCENATNVGKYIMDFECQGVGSSARMLKEMRLSFPSGHSSFTFYTMVYVALYLQARMNWRGSKLLRHFLQFLFIMIAWYTALSRVSDYKHHWSDVLAGSAIGAACAVIVSYFMPKACFNLQTVWPTKEAKIQ